MNRVTLMGNLGSDPELRVAGTGTSVMRIRLATTERVKKGEQWEEHTEWHTVTVFGKRADGLTKVLSKGSKILVEGVLRTREWEKEGVKRYSTEIIANDIELAGSRPGQDQRPPQQRQAPPQRGRQQPDTSFDYGANADPMAQYSGGDDDFPPGYAGWDQ